MYITYYYLKFACLKISKQISLCQQSSVHFDEVSILVETFLLRKLKLIQSEHATDLDGPSCLLTKYCFMKSKSFFNTYLLCARPCEVLCMHVDNNFYQN